MIFFLNKIGRNLDIFGMPISLNLGKNVKKFNTPHGIITSILVFLLVGMYSGYRSYVLFQKSETNVSSVSQPIDIDSVLGKVYFNQTKMLYFLNIYKSHETIEKYNISEYLNIKFQHWTTIVDNNTYILNKEYNVSKCT